MNNLKKEDGYILIVIVGILTVFSLMAVTFATLSRLETKASRNYADSVKCETVVKAGLEHAIYVLRLDKFGTDTTAYDSDPPDFYDENYDWSGETWMPGGGDFSGTDCDNDGNGTNDSKWVYFPATTSASDIRLPGNLRARYAVLITDDREARININATGNRAGAGNVHTSNEGLSTFEIDLSDLIQREVGNGTSTARSIIYAHSKYPRHGPDQNPGTSTTNDNLGTIPDLDTDGIDNDGDLIIDEANEGTDEPNEFNPISPDGDDEPFGPLSEVEIMGTSTYTSKLETIFNDEGISQANQGILKGYLTTYSADTIVCPEYLLDGVGTSTMLNINALINNDGAYTNAGYYTTNKKIVMLIDVLTAGGVPDVERQQMAVNIIDFTDTDDIVTQYPDGPNTYYGVERTPYINEVEGKPPGGDPEFIELYNPYNTTITIGGWTITGATLGTVTITGGATMGTDTYYVIADKVGQEQFVAGMSVADSGEVLTLADNLGNTVQVTNYGNATGPDTRTRGLNDPRPPWTWANETSSIGVQNSTFIPGGGDGWTLGTYPSSFFIANRNYFSNKGYLGYIHTGNPWTSFDVRDTIVYPNVLQYITITDPSMDGIDNDGDGDIDSADTGAQAGDIEGQEYRIPGLINVNTASAEVLESLPNIGSDTATAIATSVNKPFTSIGDLVDDVTEITGTGIKWDEEKTFRSISNLITTRSNVFTVYVTAQVTDEAMSNVLAEKRLMAIVDRSVDPIRISYLRYITTP